MTTLEDRGEIVDYVIRSLEKLIIEPQKLIEKDLSNFSLRIRKQEERLKEIIERIEKLESKTMESREEENFLSRLLS